MASGVEQDVAFGMLDNVEEPRDLQLDPASGWNGSSADIADISPPPWNACTRRFPETLDLSVPLGVSFIPPSGSV